MNQRDVIKLAREAGFQMENTAAIQAAEKLAAAAIQHYIEHCVTELTGLPYTVPALMVDMTPPATSRDRWMYEQGRLAERDPRSHVAQPEPVEPSIKEKRWDMLVYMEASRVAPETLAAYIANPERLDYALHLHNVHCKQAAAKGGAV